MTKSKKMGYENRMMKTNSKDIVNSVTVINECEMYGVGSWAAGEVITDLNVIRKVIDNPNFKPTKEGE